MGNTEIKHIQIFGREGVKERERNRKKEGNKERKGGQEGKIN